MALYKLNKAEFSTILAALRYWQADGMGNLQPALTICTRLPHAATNA